MAVIKTGISVDRDLLEQVTSLAQTLHVSRSELFSIAVRDYLKQHENTLIFDRLNEVYSAGSDPDDERVLAGMRRLYTDTVEHDW